MTILAYKPTVAKHNATVLKGISGQSVSGGLEQHEFFGDLDRHHVANLNSNMSASFSTTDLKGILDITAFSAAQLTATNKLTLYWRKQVNGASFAASSNAFSTAIQDGMISISSISCSHGQPATASVEVQPTWDGTNDPITLSKTDTEPSEVVENYAYTIAAMKFGALGASTIPLESITINMGLEIETIGGDGEAFPSFAVLSSRRPTISITTRDIGKAFDFDLLADYDGTDDMILYFARLEPGASRYADGSAQHIKVTVKAHSIMTDSVSDTSASFTVKPLWDGTNDVFQFATASTIT